MRLKLSPVQFVSWEARKCAESGSRRWWQAACHHVTLGAEGRPRFCRKPPSRVPPAPRSCALLAVQLRVRSELADLGVRAPQDLHRRLRELDAVMSRCTELAGGRAARSNSRALR